MCINVTMIFMGSVTTQPCAYHRGTFLHKKSWNLQKQRTGTVGILYLCIVYKNEFFFSSLKGLFFSDVMYQKRQETLQKIF